MDRAERAAQRMISKLILLLLIEFDSAGRDDAIAAFREARDQLLYAPLDARSRATLVAAAESMLDWLDGRPAWH